MFARAALRTRVLASRTAPAAVRGFAVGDNLIKDDIDLHRLDGTAVSTSELFENKTVVLFGVPGAFTPVCTNQHVPSFLDKAAELKKHGADTVACVSVNDRFVLGAWKDSIPNYSSDGVELLGDFDGSFIDHAGLAIDLSAAGLGVRSKRFAMVVENGVVQHENVEESPGNFDVSSADKILEILKSS